MIIMKIGIIKETKYPVDNRVALTPDQIKALIETTRIIKDCAFSTPIHQYISTKILLENLRNDKDVFLTSEPKNTPNRTIAYSEFVDIHKDVDKIDVNLSHSGIAMIGKYLMKMQKLFI